MYHLGQILVRTRRLEEMICQCLSVYEAYALTCIIWCINGVPLRRYQKKKKIKNINWSNTEIVTLISLSQWVPFQLLDPVTILLALPTNFDDISNYFWLKSKNKQEGFTMVASCYSSIIATQLTTIGVAESH